MDKRHYRILSAADALGPRDIPLDFTGDDYSPALYLCGKGLVAGAPVELPGGVDAVRILHINPSGQDVLGERRGRFGRWFLKRLDTILTATVTAVVISVATAWVTAHFAAAKEIARRTGDAECRDGRNADDGQPLAEAHYTNAVPIATVQQQRTE